VTTPLTTTQNTRTAPGEGDENHSFYYFPRRRGVETTRHDSDTSLSSSSVKTSSNTSSLTFGNMDSLREQVMINQFVLAAGCARDQAKQLLQATQWQFETALSVYFQEASVGHRQSSHFNLMTPANTPATPPNFPETLLAFSKLSASGSSDNRLTSSPAGGSFLSAAVAASQSGPSPLMATSPSSLSSPGSGGLGKSQGRPSSGRFCQPTSPNNNNHSMPITSPSNH